MAIRDLWHQCDSDCAQVAATPKPPRMGTGGLTMEAQSG